eukprot:901380-Pyramimonas_sp.AAC.1
MGERQQRYRILTKLGITAPVLNTSTAKGSSFTHSFIETMDLHRQSIHLQLHCLVPCPINA